MSIVRVAFPHKSDKTIGCFCVTIKNCKGVKVLQSRHKTIPLGSVAFKTSWGSVFHEEK